MKKIGVIGADRRLSVVGEKLRSEGYEVCFFGGETNTQGRRTNTLHSCCEGATALVLPLPYSRDGRWLNCPEEKCAVCLNAIIAEATPGCVIFGGCLDKSFCQKANIGSIKTIDYYSSEKVQILNALSTCEGAISEAICATEKTLAFSSVFVCGYGRIGSLLCEKLSLLGAKVTLVSRNENSLAKAKIRGCDICSIRELKNKIGEANIILNTVPNVIFSEDVIDKMPSDCVYIELASSPGGINREYAKEKDIKYIGALGLPSKYAPYSAGEIIADFIKEKLKEEEIV